MEKKMKNIATTSIVVISLFLLSSLQIDAASPFTPIDPAAVALKSRAELQSVFPGDDKELVNWNGYRKVILFFIEKRLEMIWIEFKEPMILSDARTHMLEIYSINLPQGIYTPSALSYRYEHMKGIVKSVSYIPADPRFPPPANPSIKGFYICFKE